MSLTIGQIGTVIVDSTTPSMTSGTYTPKAGSLVFVFSSSTGNANVTSGATISSTITGMDATKWQAVQWTPNLVSTEAISIGWCVAPSNPTSGTITVTLQGTPAEARMVIAEVTGADTVTPVVGQASTGSLTTDVTITTTQAPTMNDMFLALFGSRNCKNGFTVVDGTVLSSTSAGANPTSAMTIAYRTASTSSSMSASGMFTVSNAGAALIVKGAGAPPAISGVKVYIAGSFVVKPAKVYIGGAWVQKPVKKYKAGAWV